MKTTVILAIAGALLAAACAGTRVPQPDAPPTRAENGGRIAPGARTPTDDAATRQWLDQQTDSSATDPRQRVRGRTPTDEEATSRWLDEERERRRRVEPVPPPERVVERVVIETPPYGYDPRYYERPAASPFPYYTAFGAGLGAAIGAANDEAGEGAAIGAGVGLFLDLVRWH
jgi:hypothetical protein